MLYSEIITVCSEIHTKHINTLCGQNVELLNVKHGGTYRIHWGSEGYASFTLWVPSRSADGHVVERLNGATIFRNNTWHKVRYDRQILIVYISEHIQSTLTALQCRTLYTILPSADREAPAVHKLFMNADLNELSGDNNLR
jgi:hypothetical protein